MLRMPEITSTGLPRRLLPTPEERPWARSVCRLPFLQVDGYLVGSVRRALSTSRLAAGSEPGGTQEWTALQSPTAYATFGNRRMTRWRAARHSREAR